MGANSSRNRSRSSRNSSSSNSSITIWARQKGVSRTAAKTALTDKQTNRQTPHKHTPPNSGAGRQRERRQRRPHPFAQHHPGPAQRPTDTTMHECIPSSPPPVASDKVAAHPRMHHPACSIRTRSDRHHQRHHQLHGHQSHHLQRCCRRRRRCQANHQPCRKPIIFNHNLNSGCSSGDPSRRQHQQPKRSTSSNVRNATNISKTATGTIPTVAPLLQHRQHERQPKPRFRSMAAPASWWTPMAVALAAVSLVLMSVVVPVPAGEYTRSEIRQ